MNETQAVATGDPACYGVLSMENRSLVYKDKNGLSYLQYSNLCATMLRDALKEPLKEAAKVREIVYFKNVVYEKGQPVKQIMHDMTEVAKTADGVRGKAPAE